MNELRQLLALMFLLALSIGLSMLVMINGWGVQPKSYWWIIGAGLFGGTVLQSLLRAVSKDAK